MGAMKMMSVVCRMRRPDRLSQDHHLPATWASWVLWHALGGAFNKTKFRALAAGCSSFH
jgi:hypothetical protein